jgi:hypothetical protein
MADTEKTSDPHACPGNLNPRVWWWLKAVGLEWPAIQRQDDEDTRMVTVDGERSLWTILYSEWIRARWAEWAGTLGFTRREHGYAPHELALAGGHDAREFDTWLEATVRRGMDARVSGSVSNDQGSPS